MKRAALLPLVLTVLVAGQTENNPIFPLEACGNRTVCVDVNYLERSDDFCKDYAGQVAVPSKLCLNGVILCSNYKRAGSCFSPPSSLASNCERAIEFCYPHLLGKVSSTIEAASVTSETTTTHYETTAKETVDDAHVSVEACGNRTACLTVDGLESHEICKDYPEGVKIPSTRCVNGVIVCQNLKAIMRCLTPVRYLVNNCGYAMQSCFAYLDATARPGTTTTEVDTTTTETATTQQAPSLQGPRAGDPCTGAGKRAGNADSCLKFLECSGEVYKERACSSGYIYYEAFGFCLPGNGKDCQLYG